MQTHDEYRKNIIVKSAYYCINICKITQQHIANKKKY